MITARVEFHQNRIRVIIKTIGSTIKSFQIPFFFLCNILIAIFIRNNIYIYTYICRFKPLHMDIVISTTGGHYTYVTVNKKNNKRVKHLRSCIPRSLSPYLIRLETPNVSSVFEKSFLANTRSLANVSISSRAIDNRKVNSSLNTTIGRQLCSPTIYGQYRAEKHPKVRWSPLTCRRSQRRSFRTRRRQRVHLHSSSNLVIRTIYVLRARGS